MLGLSAVGFGLAWWLGLYLIARDPSKPVLRRAGIGLLGYALALACLALANAWPAAATPLTAVQSGLLCVPAVAWTGVLLRLLPEAVTWREWADRWWLTSAMGSSTPAILGFVLLGGFPATARLIGLGPVVPASSTEWVWHGVPDWLGLLLAGVLAVAVLGPLLAAFGAVLVARRLALPGPVGGLVLAATVLVGLGVAALLLGLGWLPQWLTVAGIGADLVVLGVVVAVADAFDEGETLRPDMRRSAVIALVTAVLFGGQIAVAMLVAPPTPAMVGLLFGGIAAAVAVQVLANPLHRMLDRVSFPDAGPLRRERAELRDVAEALPRRADAHALTELSDAEFVRLTRRALSHYGDLGRLVASPLTGLPVVARRVDGPGSPVERANQLKSLLLESITRLKPPDGEFGTSDEWRHYNALYFPYVVGLRPYSQRARHAALPATARTALRWFQSQVPERTLHNWQNAAAKLVADDLRARGFDQV
ncbi:MAG: hypothetical protein ACRDT4_03690 [Micromonosporaceae bacterium]